MRRLLFASFLALAACSGGATKPPVETHRDAEPPIKLDAGIPGQTDSGADGGLQDDATTSQLDAEADAGENIDAETGDAEIFPDAEGSDAGDAGVGPADLGVPADSGQPTSKPIVILMVGDGMGPGQLAAASHFAHGQAGQLFMESLANEGEIETGSLTGITDSAASATAMATGVKTFNRMIGTDRNEQPVETILERAQRLGFGAGVVSTASLPHATPASFSAHIPERFDYIAIADDQARNVKPFVALGGGALFYNRQGADSQRTDNGLIDPLIAQGWQYVYTRDQMNMANPALSQKLLGIFAPEHLDYVVDRPANTTQPTLTEMSLTALRFLDSYPQGFFLMIEGAKIDMASHNNDLQRAVTETLAFDEAVAAVANWASTRPDVQLIVTADHECGGLNVVTPNGQGNLPTVEWRWLLHTNARIRIFGQGPLTTNLSGIHDHTYVYQLMRAHLFNETFTPPPLVLTPDGNLLDLRHTVVSQTAPTAFGTGINELNDLRLDADEFGLFVGIEGLFEWEQNSVVLLLDRDFGASTGPASMVGAVTDTNGRVDNILRHMPVTAPVAAGFGLDFAVVSWGGWDPKLDEVSDDGGLRRLTPPNDLPWLAAATNYGEGVRTRGGPTTVRPDEGFEVFIPWDQLYPDLMGGVPVGGTVGVAAVLVNGDGRYLSNQTLPPFPATQTTNPGNTATALPGVVSFVIDQDGDGVGDGDAVPVVR